MRSASSASRICMCASVIASALGAGFWRASAPIFERAASHRVRWIDCGGSALGSGGGQSWCRGMCSLFGHPVRPAASQPETSGKRRFGDGNNPRPQRDTLKSHPFRRSCSHLARRSSRGFDCRLGQDRHSRDRVRPGSTTGGNQNTMRGSRPRSYGHGSLWECGRGSSHQNKSVSMVCSFLCHRRTIRGMSTGEDTRTLVPGTGKSSRAK